MTDDDVYSPEPVGRSKPLIEVDESQTKHPYASIPVPPESARVLSSTNDKSSNSILGRALSKQNKDAARHFFSAYAQTWVGLSPVWLMGEALAPGAKVGTQFKKGKAKLLWAAEEIRVAVSTSSRDIVVIVDEKLGTGKIDTGKTAEVLKAAGENAILVVSSSLEKAQAQLQQLNVEYGPKIRQSVSSNGRDIIVILDKALKHPVVITGVSKFAKSRGIPHADALLRLASLALAKILNALPETHLEGIEGVVEEIDAAELERTSSQEDQKNAAEVGRQGDGDRPQVTGTPGEMTTPQENLHQKAKKNLPCVIA